jgi:hypothetical protein
VEESVTVTPELVGRVGIIDERAEAIACNQ